MQKVNRINNFNFKALRVVAIAAVLCALPVSNVLQANASPITERSVVLSSSVGDAAGVTYSLATAALPTNTVVKSAEIKFCTSLSGECNTPAGFSASGASLASQPTGLGSVAGWTADTSTPGSLRISNSSNSTAPTGSVAIAWNGVHNPTATNTAFYGIITTYSDSAWTTPLDSGSVAMSTSTQIQVALTVGEMLTFCTGTSITAQNCGTATGSVVNLGQGSTASTATGTSMMSASTNGESGYSVTVNGSTLASGANTIKAMDAGGASVVNSPQFGLNLADTNTTPVVGSAKTGSGTATATTNYGINNNFRFKSGDVIASVSGPTNANTFTIGYIANIDGLTPAGAYNTALTYMATANF